MSHQAAWAVWNGSGRAQRPDSFFCHYIIYNPPIQHGITGAGLVWAFKTRHASNWHPLTWVSHMADCALYGLNPGGHHLTNLLFHTANVVLLFLVLCQWTGAPWRSALVAALFAWHPLHVESVAWVSERKDVLSAMVAGALGFLLAGAEAQLQHWRNSVALFSHTVAVTRNNILAEYNLAEALARQGDEAQAVVHYQRALAIEPNRVEANYNSQTQAHYNLGLIFRARKQWAEAEAQFRACLRDDPSLARAHSNLDAVLGEMYNDKARGTKK